MPFVWLLRSMLACKQPFPSRIPMSFCLGLFGLGGNVLIHQTHNITRPKIAKFPRFSRKNPSIALNPCTDLATKDSCDW